MPRPAKVQGDEAPGDELYVAAAKDPVEYRAYIDFGNDVPAAHRALAIQGAASALPVVLFQLPGLQLVEFIKAHGGGRPEIHVADLFTDSVIHARVDFHIQVKALRVAQEEWRTGGTVREGIAIPVGRPEGRAVGVDNVSRHRVCCNRGGRVCSLGVGKRSLQANY